MLSGKADGDRRQQPEIELIAPTSNDSPCKLLRNDGVRVKRQVRAMLLERSERQTQDRALPEPAAHIRKCQLSHRSAGARSLGHARSSLLRALAGAAEDFHVIELVARA